MAEQTKQTASQETSTYDEQNENIAEEQQTSQENADAEINQTQDNDTGSSAETDGEQNGEQAAEEQEKADQTAVLEQQIEELKDRNLRLQAEFDNFRKRTRQEKEEFAKYASLKLIEQLLPVIDNFERAIDSSKDTQDLDALVKGIDMVFRQMKQVMEQEGLERIEAVGQPFDPELHQAVMQVESDEHEEGIVVEEMQSGYMLKGKVIRPSMVKVSS